MLGKGTDRTKVLDGKHGRITWGLRKWKCGLSPMGACRILRTLIAHMLCGLNEKETLFIGKQLALLVEIFRTTGPTRCFA
jgi:hypothetical protein